MFLFSGRVVYPSMLTHRDDDGGGDDVLTPSPWAQSRLNHPKKKRLDGRESRSVLYSETIGCTNRWCFGSELWYFGSEDRFTCSPVVCGKLPGPGLTRSFFFAPENARQVVQMHVHSSYLYRMTALYAIQVLTESLDVDMLSKVILCVLVVVLLLCEIVAPLPPFDFRKLVHGGLL